MGRGRCVFYGWKKGARRKGEGINCTVDEMAEKGR